MYTTGRILAIIGVFCGATVAWLALAAVTSQRSSSLGSKLGPEVEDLWGRPQRQTSPTFTFSWKTYSQEEESVEQDGKTRHVTRTVEKEHSRDVLPSITTLGANIHLDHRLKGMLWYALYDVVFDGAWTYVHEGPEAWAACPACAHPQAYFELLAENW